MQSTNPSIRVANEADAAALAELAERTFRETFAAQNTPENMDLHCRSSYGADIQRREIADPLVTTLVCDTGGELISYGQLRRGHTPECVAGAAPVEIQRLYVSSAWHGKGIAQQLMSSMLETAAQERADVVWLGVWERNPRAIAFYRKSGFIEVGDHVFPLGTDPQRDVVMAMTLSDDRDLVTSRVVDAPPELVFDAFANPARLARWWGPSGFTNTFHEFDFRPGGSWRFVMHSPDGSDFRNESEFVEIAPARRVVVHHASAPEFELTISFIPDDGKTRVGWRQRFTTAETCRRIAEYAVPGNEQNLDRLEEELRRGKAEGR